MCKRATIGCWRGSKSILQVAFLFKRDLIENNEVFKKRIEWDYYLWIDAPELGECAARYSILTRVSRSLYFLIHCRLCSAKVTK